jgi:hypothetical protein
MPTTYRDLGGNNLFGVPINNASLGGTITTGGIAQQLVAAGTTRKGVRGQNISTGDLWINEGGTAVVDGIGSYKVVSGQTFDTSFMGSLSIIGATTGQKFSATEY